MNLDQEGGDPESKSEDEKINALHQKL